MIDDGQFSMYDDGLCDVDSFCSGNQSEFFPSNWTDNFSLTEYLDCDDI